MAARPYTETFIRTNLPAVNVTYTVPAGKRAVITSITATNAAASSGVVHVMAGGIYLAHAAFQALYEARAWQLRAALYAGDQLVVHNAGQGLNCTVAGYLFDDPSAAAYDDHPLTYTELELLPAGPPDSVAA